MAYFSRIPWYEVPDPQNCYVGPIDDHHFGVLVKVNAWIYIVDFGNDVNYPTVYDTQSAAQWVVDRIDEVFAELDAKSWQGWQPEHPDSEVEQRLDWVLSYSPEPPDPAVTGTYVGKGDPEELRTYAPPQASLPVSASEYLPPSYEAFEEADAEQEQDLGTIADVIEEWTIRRGPGKHCRCRECRRQYSRSLDLIEERYLNRFGGIPFGIACAIEEARGLIQV